MFGTSSKSGEGLFGNGLINLNIITDLSVDGINGVYTGFFTQDFVDNVLLKRNDVDFIEKVIPVTSIIDSPIIIEEKKRATQTSAPFVCIIYTNEIKEVKS
jgi:hypothetical protein